jgi:hypothetical protein
MEVSMQIATMTKRELITTMVSHDWDYWKKPDRAEGEATRDRIDAELAKLPYKEARAIWREYAPLHTVYRCQPGQPQ